jgi:hypothetical protein
MLQAVQSLMTTDWAKLFRGISMVLFVAYPSVSVKIFRLFQCREVDGLYWLAVDMRLQCYTSEWTGYAIYGGVMLIVYVIGLPFGTFVLLYRKRHSLFGPGSEETLRR